MTARLVPDSEVRHSLPTAPGFAMGESSAVERLNSTGSYRRDRVATGNERKRLPSCLALGIALLNKPDHHPLITRATNST